MRLTLCTLFLLLEVARGFAPAAHRATFVVAPTTTTKLCSTPDDKDSIPDAEGSDLAAEFFKMAKNRNIELEDDDLDDEEDWDDDDDGDVAEKKEPLLATPPSEDSGDSEDREEIKAEKPKEYKPPTKIPDAELTAGQVVELVLAALKNNDVPTKNRGIEILFGYSSESSQIKQMDDLTPDEYFGYLQEGDYKAVFENMGVRVDKGEYSGDGSKAYFTARIQTGPKDFTPVNFILSTGGLNESDAWMVDSMLIRPPGMRKSRRR